MLFPHRKQGQRRKLPGFSLIELLVIVTIIALLATMVMVSVGRAQIQARDGKRISDLHAIATALDQSKINSTNDAYPSSPCENLTWSVLDARLQRMVKPYLAAMPTDPLTTNTNPSYNEQYIYISNIYDVGSCVGDVAKSHEYYLEALLENTVSSQLNGNQFPQSPDLVDCCHYQHDNPPSTGTLEDSKAAVLAPGRRIFNNVYVVHGSDGTAPNPPWWVKAP